MTDVLPPNLTDDAILGGRLRLFQPSRGHRAGTDAVLLAAMVPAKAGEHIVDLGAGVGTAGLAVLTRVEGVRATLLEIDPDIAALAERNASRNGLAAGVSVRIADAGAVGKGQLADLARQADHVLANPPFNPPGGNRPPDEATARARLGEAGLLEAWAKGAARLLKAGGSFSLIHRPEALPEILSALGSRFGGISFRFVHPSEDRAAVRLLVQARKGSRAPIRVLPPLVLSVGQGIFTPAVEALHRDLAGLEM